MRKPIIAGNWKMNKTPSEAKALVEALAPLVADASCDVVVCPPAVNLTTVAEAIKGTNIKLGAQLTGESTGSSPMHILGAQLDVAAFSSFLHSGKVHSGHAHDHVADGVSHEGLEFVDQSGSFRGGLVHLPVASDDSLTHDDVPLSMIFQGFHDAKAVSTGFPVETVWFSCVMQRDILLLVQSSSLSGGLVHLPVASDDRLAHSGNLLYIVLLFA